MEQSSCMYCGKPLVYRDATWWHVGSGEVCCRTTIFGSRCAFPANTTGVTK